MCLQVSFKHVMLASSFSMVFFLGGCASSDVTEFVEGGNAMATTHTKLSPTSSSAVKVYDSSNKPHHYRVVGRISADNYNMVGIEHSQESVLEELQKQAASLGANGVINLSQGMAQTTAEAIVTK